MAVVMEERKTETGPAVVAKGGATPAVEIAGVNLVFQTADTPVYALSDVDLTVGRGEFVSFIGPSGCGKTTLLRVIADLQQVTGGSVRVNGVSPQTARLDRAYGYVFQAPALYPWRIIFKDRKSTRLNSSR